MTARILDGNAVAQSIRRDIAAAVEQRLQHGLRRPGVAVLLVGDDPASGIYVKHKRRDCREVGYKHDIRHLSAATAERTLIDTVDELMRMTPSTAYSCSSAATADGRPECG